jgi:ribosomal protein L40E
LPQFLEVEPVSMPMNSTVSPATKVILGCSKCGATLPDEAQFCLKCGKSVSLPLKEPVKSEGPVVELAPPRVKKRRIVLWVLLGLLLGGFLWAATSDSPFAQGIQELVGWKHDQTILETPFSVSAHNFRYYKFDLPEGSTNVSIIGQFTASSSDKKAGAPKSKAMGESEDNDVEVYVLSEPAFAVWQNGYATSSVYESGRVSQGTMQAELPAGAGVYYLIFSNKFSSKTVKSINATVLLRYKSWLPESFRRTKERFWNWVGL